MKHLIHMNMTPILFIRCKVKETDADKSVQHSNFKRILKNERILFTYSG